MKKIFAILIIAFGSSISTNAQSNVGINNSAPDASAALMIDTTAAGPQGILIPRMTQARRNAITSPATGLMIYQSDNTPGFYYNSGTTATPNWKITGGSVPHTQLPNTFVGHATGSGAPQNYFSPLEVGQFTSPSSISAFYIASPATINVTFYTYDDEPLTFELFELNPAAGANAYTTTGTALATASTTAWTSGPAISSSFSASVSSGKLYTIKVTKTGGGNINTNAGLFTAFYAN